MLNINQFKSSVNKHDLQRPNLFVVEFGVPRVFNTNTLEGYNDVLCSVDNMRLVQHFCKNVSMPSFSLNLSDNRRFGIGPNIKMPVGGTYGDVSMTFLSDSELVLRNFYQAWMGSIYGMSHDQNVPGQGRFHQLRYKKSYQSDISIVVLKGKKEQYNSSKILGIGVRDLAQGAISAISAATQTPFIGSLFSSAFIKQSYLEEAAAVTLVDAYPTSISEINLSSESSNVVSEFTVTFSYRDWYFKTPPSADNLNDWWS